MSPLLLRELFSFTDWAREKSFALVTQLNDEQLDRPFEMGIGSIRSTLHHIWAAERVWLDRWTQGGVPKFVFPEAGLPLAELHARARATADERDGYLSGLSNDDLRRPLTFTNIKKETYSLPLGGQMLHVCNHGIHHRAQFVNMVRRVGGELPKRGLDYIFFRLENPATPEIEVQAIRSYQAYADWGTRKMLKIAGGLTEGQLDRSFEMGMGTIRKTLVHLLDAECWWHHNWTKGPAGAFPDVDNEIPMAALVDRLDAAWAARDEFVAGLSDGNLTRPVTVKPKAEMTLQFPLGVTLVQICGHATHHRAQLLNMFRHIGAETPGLDLVLWLRDQ